MNKLFTYSISLHSLHLHVSEEGWMWMVLRKMSFTFTPLPSIPFSPSLRPVCFSISSLDVTENISFAPISVWWMGGNPLAHVSVCLVGWLVFLLCLSSCLDAISDRTEGENFTIWFTIRKWESFMNILKFLKYATCPVLSRLDLKRNSLTSAGVPTVRFSHSTLFVVWHCAEEHRQRNNAQEDWRYFTVYI